MQALVISDVNLSMLRSTSKESLENVAIIWHFFLWYVRIKMFSLLINYL